MCTDACNLAAHTGCPEPLGCHPTGPLSERVADCAYRGDDAVGDPCTTHDTCVAGSICVIFGEGRCSSICRFDGDCPSFDCARLMTPVIVDGVEYGACR